MKAEKDILEQSVKALRNNPFPSGPDQQTIDSTIAALAKASGQTYEVSHKKQTIMERIITMKTYSKLAVAAVLVIAAVISISILNKSATPAYAIEQTIEAMRSVHSVHAFCTDWENRRFEMWIKVNPETGENDCHYLNEPERGQISISTPEITYFYHPKENKVRIVEGQALRSDIRFGRFIEDVLDKIIKPAQSNIQINKDNDPNTGKEIIMLWAESPDYEMEAFVDPETKLPIRINFAKAISGQMLKSIDEIYYNEPLPEGLFDFQIPEGAEVIREQTALLMLEDPNCSFAGNQIDKWHLDASGNITAHSTLVVTKIPDDAVKITITMPYADAKFQSAKIGEVELGFNDLHDGRCELLLPGEKPSIQNKTIEAVWTISLNSIDCDKNGFRARLQGFIPLYSYSLALVLEENCGYECVKDTVIRNIYLFEDRSYKPRGYFGSCGLAIRKSR